MLILFLLLVLPLVSATIELEDSKSTICSCETAKFVLSINNPDSIAHTYYLSLEGSAAKWSILSQDILRIAPEDFKEVTIFATPDCNILGKYSIILTAVDDKDKTQSEDLSINVNACENFYISTAKELDLCDGSEVKVPITITGKGQVSLTSSGVSWVKFDKSDLYLFPPYDLEGDFIVKIIAKSASTKSESNILLQVKKCHSTSLEIEKQEDSICGSKTYAVTLKNTGSVDETYVLSVDGPTWAGITAESVTLGEGESKVFSLIVDPKHTGTYNIKIKAKSENPCKTSASDSIKINVQSQQQCHGLVFSTEKYVNLKPEESKEVTITAENTGSEASTYSFELSGSGKDIASINPAKLTIKSKEKAYTSLKISSKEKGSYNLIISAKGDDEKALSVRITVSEPSNLWGRITGYFSKIDSKWAKDNKYMLIATIIVIALLIIGFACRKKLSEWINQPPGPKLKWDGEVRPKPQKGPKIAEKEEKVVPENKQIAEIKKKMSKYSLQGLKDTDIKKKLLSEGLNKKLIAKAMKKSIWQKFQNWLDEELPEKPKKEEKKAKKSYTEALKKDKPGLFSKFNAWLNEGETKKIVQKKSIKLPKKGSAWQKFKNWLDESDEEPKSKPKIKKSTSKKPKAETKKSKNGFIQRFNKWLDEE